MTNVVVLQVCRTGCAGQLWAEHGLPGPGAPGRGCVWQRRVCCRSDKSEQPSCFCLRTVSQFLSIKISIPCLSCEAKRGPHVSGSVIVVLRKDWALTCSTFEEEVLIAGANCNYACQGDAGLLPA